jgi:hypothetical protein
LITWRIEILTTASGVDFGECVRHAVAGELNDGTVVPIISLEDLKRYQAAAGRPKDLDDLEHLP